MATPGEKLANSLEVLKALQDQGIMAIKTSELGRVHRERLTQNGFLEEVVKGWYLPVPLDAQSGDTTIWYSNYWHFCQRYLFERFEKSYCLSAEQSLQIHSGNWTVPHQLIVRSTKGTNSSTPLPHRSSLFSMKSTLPEAAEIMEVEGIRILTLPSALIHCSSTMFNRHATDVRTALAMIRDSSEILRLLLDGGHSTIAGRIAGAFQNIGQDRIANDIVKTMQSVGYDVRVSDPFEDKTPIILSTREKSPYANRIRLMWHEMRIVVLKYTPQDRLPIDKNNYMQLIKEIHTTDSYHSLSIEQYKVTPELIERVKNGKWDGEKNAEDRQQKDAMAAKGYWQAAKKVWLSVEKVLAGENPATVVDKDHGEWYRELFSPSVTAGIIKASDLAGYRNRPVIITHSKHVPPNSDALLDVMQVLFELIHGESEAFVRAVLGHFVFVYIHPYIDGNSRMGRFLMNVMLASGKYTWTVIPVERRKEYMETLEQASVSNNIEPFAKFVANLVTASNIGKPIAKIKTTNITLYDLLKFGSLTVEVTLTNGHTYRGYFEDIGDDEESTWFQNKGNDKSRILINLSDIVNIQLSKIP